jgi:hypothetical protein
MASLWEILNVGTLKYDTTLGATLPDSGEGPPTDVYGWIRTGGPAASFIGDPGGDAGTVYPNCSAWTSANGSGTAVALSTDWFHRLDVEVPGRVVTDKDIAPWTMAVPLCTAVFPFEIKPRVWCIQNR